MKFEDKVEVISMMKTFYFSEAVFTNGSDEIFEADFKACINNSPYLEGYVFTSDEIILGYAMLAKSFSTEFGKSCIWFEDLYLKPEYRGQRIIPKFIRYAETVHKDFPHVFSDKIHRSLSIFSEQPPGFLKTQSLHPQSRHPID